jgi:hypothetical protein
LARNCLDDEPLVRRSRAFREIARQKLTGSDTSRRSIAALRKDHSALLPADLMIGLQAY